ncbi:hypothetical protein PFAG_02817 [Plasmodium falciparum Santa Lucia]|uniref:Uncharacterized protein n=1 Tax=Plasmodium falciparum Santa Lucia TaxID=478859 RepID=W7FYL7_PLAFA|nr:hypothetical protein PFAG_02817 [Plasmodium falciparum Santa Lucia]
MNYIKMIFIIYILSKVFIKCMNHMRRCHKNKINKKEVKKIFNFNL